MVMSGYQSAKLPDTSDFSVVQTWTMDHDTGHIALGPSGEHFFIARYDSRSIQHLVAESSTPDSTFGAPRVYGLAVTTDGTRMIGDSSGPEGYVIFVHTIDSH